MSSMKKEYEFLKEIGLGSRNLGCYINGLWQGNGPVISSVNPANNQVWLVNSILAFLFLSVFNSFGWGVKGDQIRPLSTWIWSVFFFFLCFTSVLGLLDDVYKEFKSDCKYCVYLFLIRTFFFLTLLATFDFWIVENCWSGWSIFSRLWGRHAGLCWGCKDMDAGI